MTGDKSTPFVSLISFPVWVSCIVDELHLTNTFSRNRNDLIALWRDKIPSFSPFCLICCNNYPWCCACQWALYVEPKRLCIFCINLWPCPSYHLYISLIVTLSITLGVILSVTFCLFCLKVIDQYYRSKNDFYKIEIFTTLIDQLNQYQPLSFRSLVVGCSLQNRT